MRSLQALRSHIGGSKHKENLAKPAQVSDDMPRYTLVFKDPSEFTLLNGKWKKIKGDKRGLSEDDAGRLSKRERTKLNKVARDIPILAQHTEERYKETETFFEGGLRKVSVY